MEYEWDSAKAAANLAKHGVPFEAIERFDWDHVLIYEDNRFRYSERRFNAFAEIDGRMHALVFTMRGQAIRIIGLRKANAREIRRYEKEKA